MKKIFLFILTCFISLISIAQTTVDNPPDENVVPPICPYGYHLVIIREFDFENFHRVVRHCLSGFWFCIRHVSTYYKCEPDVPITTYKSIISNENKVNVIIELKNDKVVFHFPEALKNVKSYSKEDLAAFNVDEALLLNFGAIKCRLIVGDYVTEIVNNEIIAKVNYTIE
ncbi:MAG: hypothetical protein ABL929_07285 [Ferruginibacter sp.]